MRLSRALHQAIARLLIGVLLFAQFAVTGHACAHMAGMAAMSSADSAVAVAPGSDPTGQDAPNLCAEHCSYGQQSADTATGPVVRPTIPTLLYALPAEPAHRLGSCRSHPASEAGLAVAQAPPHAILHCVFRI